MEQDMYSFPLDVDVEEWQQPFKYMFQPLNVVRQRPSFGVRSDGGNLISLQSEKNAFGYCSLELPAPTTWNMMCCARHRNRRCSVAAC